MIFLILLLGAILRLININQSLWLDEASQVLMSSKSIYSIWFERTGDFHPPLSYLISHFWLFLGQNEVVLRILPLLFGLGTILITYYLVKKLFDQKTALLTTILIAISPYHIYYSQEFRMYSQATFLTVLSMFLFINLLESKRKSWIFFYLLSSAALIYTHYLTAFVILSQILFVIIFYRKKSLDFLGCLLLVLLSFFPWIPQLLKQLSVGSTVESITPLWAEILSLSTLKSIPLTLVKFTIGRISFENIIFYSAISIFILVFIFYLFFSILKKASQKNMSLILLWFFVPIIGSIFFSLFIPVFQPFRLLYTLPAFYILLALGIYNTNFSKKILISILVFISLFGLSLYYLDQKFWREDWRNAVSFINNEARENDLVLFAWPEPFPPYQYYKGSKNTLSVAKNIPSNEFVISREMEGVGNYQRVFFFEYLQALSDPQKNIQEQLKQKGFKIKATHNYNGVGFIYEFEKNQ